MKWFLQKSIYHSTTPTLTHQSLGFSLPSPGVTPCLYFLSLFSEQTYEFHGQGFSHRPYLGFQTPGPVWLSSASAGPVFVPARRGSITGVKILECGCWNFVGRVWRKTGLAPLKSQQVSLTLPAWSWQCRHQNTATLLFFKGTLLVFANKTVAGSV